MPDIPRLLERAAAELTAHTNAGDRVGLERDEMTLLAQRLSQWSRMPVPDAVASLSTMAALFGDDRAAWASLSPAFVALMDAVRDA